MDNNQSSKNAISHKELNDFLMKAQKDISSTDSSCNNKNQEFYDLIKTWTEASQKILLMINKEDRDLIENSNPKSLMALGAMGAHINMALQVLKSAESDL